MTSYPEDNGGLRQLHHAIWFARNFRDPFAQAAPACTIDRFEEVLVEAEAQTIRS